MQLKKKKLRNRLLELEKMLDLPNETTENELNKIRNSLKEIDDHQLKRAIIKLRVKWIEWMEIQSVFITIVKNIGKLKISPGVIIIKLKVQ